MKGKRISGLILAAALTVSNFVGCTRQLTPPDLGGVYDRSAQLHGPETNPVIVIPGILGSRLVDDASGQVVWGAFSGDFANPERPDGARLAAIPFRENAPLADLRDDVRPDGALESLKVSVLGLPITLNAYIDILATLGAGGYRDSSLEYIDYGDDHFTCFQFDYDWRRDNVENAQRLAAFIEEKREFIRAQRLERYGVADSDVKFDIVAHSMGGLITRYYLRYGDADLPADGSAPPITWAGAANVENAILVGTPNQGSVQALTQLVDGVEFAPIVPAYEPALLGTMPAIYQLLPRPRHGLVTDASGEAIDVYDPDVWRGYGWGLVAPHQDRMRAMLAPEATDEARLRLADDHLVKCLARAQAFAEALDTPAAPPDGVDLMLFAGDASATAARLSVDANGRVRITEEAPGDGTVTRASALADERVGDEVWTRPIRTPITWSRVTFIFADHLGLTRDAAFSDNVLYELLEAP